MKPTTIRITCAFRATGTDAPTVEYYSTIKTFCTANGIDTPYQGIIYSLRERGQWYCEQTGQWMYRCNVIRQNYSGSKHKHMVVISDRELSDISAFSQARLLKDHTLGSEGYHYFTKNAPKGDRNATVRYKEDWVIARKILKTPVQLEQSPPAQPE